MSRHAWGVKALALAVAVGAATIAAPGAATSHAEQLVANVAPQRFLTLAFGRSNWSVAENCVAPAGAMSLGDIAVGLAQRGHSAISGVVLNRTNEASHRCYNAAVLQSSWADLDQLRDDFGWTAISQSVSYPNMTTLTPEQQEAESCATLPVLEAHGHHRAYGMFNYPNDKLDLQVQTDIVSRCFDFGRDYRNFEVNHRAAMAAPWFAATTSIAGGRCNDPALDCYSITVAGNTRYNSPERLANLVAVGEDAWVILQAYRLVTGAHTDGTTRWDCTSDDWREHWTNQVEVYCWDDYFAVIDAIPADVTDADPATVAEAWGRTLTPAAPTLTAQPPALTNDRDATFSFASPDGGVDFECTLDGAAGVPCTSPVEFAGLDDGAHEFSVLAVRSGARSDATAWNWSIDTVAPDVSIDGVPPDPDPVSTATLQFSSADPTATFECSVDGATPASCSSPFVAGPLADGVHDFVVEAHDPAGNISAPAAYEWIVDTTAPDVYFTDHPPARSAATAATVGFATDDPAAAFVCTVDGGMPQECASPVELTDLADGPHAVSVVARDALGNAAAPIEWAWTVDTVAPGALIVDGPGTPSIDATATLRFISDEGDSTFRCSLDSAEPEPCTSPASVGPVGLGDHTFTVVATDGAGNASAPATWVWSADPVVDLSLEITPTELFPGRVATVSATATYASGAVGDVGTIAPVTVSDPTVARSVVAGSIEAIGLGTTSVCIIWGAVPACHSLVVREPQLVAIRVDLDAAELAIGATTQATAVGEFDDGTFATLTDVAWSTAAGEVATVTGDGFVQANGGGTTAIVAYSGAVTGSHVLDVTGPVLVALEVRPAAVRLRVGETVQLDAVGTYDDASDRILTSVVTWATDHPDTAGVDTSGVVHGLANGSGSVTAELGSVTGTAAVDVDPQQIDLGVQLSGPTNAVVGTTVTYVVTVDNAGPSTATGVVVTTAVAGALYSESVDSVGATCTGLQCTLDAIPAGSSATVTLSVLPRAKGSLTVSAAVVATESDSGTRPDTTSHAVVVGAGADGCTILGTPGDDTLVGTTAADVMCGAGGNDRLDGLGGNDTLRGDSGDDVLIGGAGADQILGGTGDDNLNGGGGADTLVGDAGNDQLNGGAGNDTFDGGPGTDRANYANTPAGNSVSVDLQTGIATGAATGIDHFVEDPATLHSSVEDIAGTPSNDILNGDGGPNLLMGLGGSDVLSGREGADVLNGGQPARAPGDQCTDPQGGTFVGCERRSTSTPAWSPAAIRASRTFRW